MIKVAENKQKIDEIDNSVKEKENELEQLGKELQLSMLGTVDREIKKEQVEKASKEFEEIKKEKERQQKDLNEKFENSKSDLISSIDEEMSKYKRKSKIDNLKSQKQAYERVAENAQKTIENAIKDFNEGKQINNAIVDNAREELKANKEKAAEIENQLERCIEIESNLEQYKDLEYLKARTQGLSVTGIDKNFESKFVSKYFEDKEKENKKEQKNNEENLNIIPESSKDESKQQGNETTTKSNEPSDEPEIELNEPKNEIETEPNNNEIANEQEGFNVLRDPSKEEIKEQGDKIIDDLGKDYKNLKFSFKLETDDKKDISIFISENDKVIKCKDKDGVMTNIPMDALKDENKNMFKRLDIGKKCRKIKKEIKGKRLAGLTLKRKLNPEIIRALDRTENRDLIEKYIESVYTKSEFPFELKHDLSGLKRREKLALRKYTKTEEKCGAQILGKIWDKNKALGEGKKDVDKLEQESKAEIAANVEKMMKDEKSKKDKTPLVPRVDGKNAEIAKKYDEKTGERKQSLEDLLNTSNLSLDAKGIIENYAKTHGEEEAKSIMNNYVKAYSKEKIKTENEPVKKEAQEIEDTGR